MGNTIEQWLASHNISAAVISSIELIFSLSILVVIILLSTWVTRRFVIPLIEKSIKQSANVWDDILVAKDFFNRLSWLPSVVLTYFVSDLIFPAESVTAELIKRLTMVFFVLITVRALDAFSLVVQDIYSRRKTARDKPIRGYLQAIKLIIYIMAVIFIIAILINKSPWGILSVLGGLTAILILVFRDTLLGFTAGIQLSGNDMVRVGDWIEMPQYNADGDVIDISIYTVKVQNWDNTISTIPTQSMVMNSFKNWRGMSESGGRRIKRAVYIDMTSIMFCTDEMVERFQKITILHAYIDNRKKEITQYNQSHPQEHIDNVNCRRQTNIGIFRAYIVAYLKNHPQIHQDMTFLVRQLQPTSQGLPLEIYVFSKDKVWANYENIQADIFDHILAIIPEFGLCIFQYPAGSDFKAANDNIGHLGSKKK